MTQRTLSKTGVLVSLRHLFAEGRDFERYRDISSIFLKGGDYNVVRWSWCRAVEGKEQDNPQQEVFSGWKEIARYLGKSVRTVQRHERELGLPVRRVSGNRKGSVVAAKSDLDLWLKSSPTMQESFNRSSRTIQEYLSSEIAKGFGQRAELVAQMTALRTELKTSVCKLRESISNLRQQLNETRRLQDSMASVIRRSLKVRDLSSVDVKHRKPN